MDAGDLDDDGAMAYFLPNGIADDSPPKPSRFATPTSSGFGQIGTPSAVAASSFFGPSVSSGSSSPAVQEFAAPSLLRPSVLEHPPFRSTRASSTDSPRQANYLLSDLGGEIHEPGRGPSLLELRDRAESGLGDNAVSRSGFGFPGSARSPSSRTFDRGQDAALGLPFARPRNYSGTSQSIGRLMHDQDPNADQGRPMRTSSSSFDMGRVVTTSGLLYSGESSSASSGLSAAPSFLGHSSEESFFGSASIRNWPSHTASPSQPRKKMLATPPGLSPPGLGRKNSPLSQLATEREAVGGISGGRGPHFDSQMDASAPPFDPFKNASVGGSIGAFSGANARPLEGSSGRIGSHLSHLGFSPDAFAVTPPQRRQEESLAHDGVANRDLAELNTQSVIMDGVASSSDILSDSSPTRSPWQDTSSARRIEVQAKPKTGRGSYQPSRDRKRPETSLEIRGGSPLPLASNTASSPLRVHTLAEKSSSAVSPSPFQGSSSLDVAATSGEMQWAESLSTSKGRRRHHASGATPKSSSSYAVVVGAAASAVSVTDPRQKAQVPDSSTDTVLRSGTADASELPPAKATSARDGAKSKRKDPISEAKAGGKKQLAKKTVARGTVDKGATVSASTSVPTADTTPATVSRRQVFREKQKSSAKDVDNASAEGSDAGGTSSSSPNATLNPTQETVKASTEEVKLEAKARRRRQRDTKEAKQSDTTTSSASIIDTAEGQPPPVSSEAIKLASASTISSEPVATSFATVVASNSKQRKPTKKEPNAKTPTEVATSKATAKSAVDASEETSKAGETTRVEEVPVQKTPQEMASASSSETSESKEASMLVEEAVSVVATVSREEEESNNVVSNDSSSSDVEKAQLSTDDEFEMVPRYYRDDVTSADESLAPAASTHASSSHEPKRSKKGVAKIKEKQKKEKTDRKKSSKSKKDKRSPPASGGSNPTDAAQQDDPLASLPSELIASHTPTVSARALATIKAVAVWTGTTAVAAVFAAVALWKRFVERTNLKVGLATAFSYVESVIAVVLSVVLLLALHGASWFIRVHRVAFRALLSHRHVGFCFAFLYGFPALVHHIFPWAPPWAPVCLWYAFLVQLFCTNGPTAMMTTFRIILPLVFLVEGISHHSFLLDLNGAELLLTSFILSALKTSNLFSPIFFLSLATQCLLAVFLGSELIVQWVQLAVALYSLHLMASTEEWVGFGDDDDDLAYHQQQQQQHLSSGSHSIADYNHHPAPSSAVSIQKTKRLDRRALAYVRGRKVR